ncbi:hypothetical protein CYR40_02255 [Chimaeribacter arupi]|uniref:Ig-like domain-containing protein n=1 Tax=Chimaeribacter arupi TaxID=2060066 RepID=UPI000C7E5AEB|nr:Ig-like domain-containing protein [Chimaeribacter arupi]PLR49917.1 hypothetical protein CYR40_02255 [Chimaeribacter arupi]
MATATYNSRNAGSLIAPLAASDLIIDPLSGDNALNAAEAAQPLVISGTTTQTAPDSSVTVLLNDVPYSAAVNADGTWRATVPVEAVSALPDGLQPVVATITLADGSTQRTEATLAVHVTNLPQAVLNPPATLNLAQTQSDQTLTGSTGVSGDGQSVVVALNGQTYRGEVAADGSWSVTLPSGALQALAEGSYPVNVTVTDAAGNLSTTGGSLALDITAPQLAIDPVTGDNLLNQRDVQSGITVTGQSGEAGSTVTVDFNNQAYTATVAADGTWRVAVPAADLAGLTGDYALTATTTDSAGNPATARQTVTVDNSNLPQLAITPFTGDNQLDSAERGVAQELNGTTTNVEAGQVVTVTLNNHTYLAPVQADGSWHLIVPQADMSLLPTGALTLSAGVADAAGNTASTRETLTVVSGGQTVAIDTLAGDNILNAAEATTDLTLSGVAQGLAAGNTVTVTLNGVTYTTTLTSNATINGGTTWRATVPAADLAALEDGSYSVTAEVRNSSGGLITSTQDLLVVINTQPELLNNTPFGDGYLNVAEAAAGQTLSGYTGVTGAGQSVTVSLSGRNFTATVEESGLWRAAIPAEVLQALPSGLVTYTVTASDIAGNTVSGPGAFTVDFTPPGVHISPLTADNIVNTEEAARALTLQGTSADVPINTTLGAAVVVTLNGETYTTTVTEDGIWTIPLPRGALAGLPDGSYPITATIIDDAGNSTSVTGAVTLAAGPLSTPVITFDAFAGDNVLNSAEQNTAQTLSGHADHVEAGLLVTLALNGRTYTAAVQPDGSWSTAIPANDLRLLSDGSLTVNAAVTNSAGNSATASDTLTVDLNRGGISVNPLAGDGMLNVAEQAAGLTLSGTTAGVPEGSTVTVILNGQNYTTQTDGLGLWTLTLPPEALAGLPDGRQTVNISTLDADGDPVFTTAPLNVYLHSLPHPTLDTPFVDGRLNAAEVQAPQTLTGHTGLTGPGQSVSLALGGLIYTGTVDESGVWQLTLPPSAFRGLAEGTTALDVVVSDLAGNTALVSGNVQVDFTAPTLVVNTIAGDNIANAREMAAGVSLSGSGSEVGGVVNVTVLFNNITYEATVRPGGGWSLRLPPGALVNLPDGRYDLQVSLTDAAGNTATETRSLVLDGNAATLPRLRIDTVSGDNRLHGADLFSDQIITGSADNVETGQRVQLKIGANTYTTVIQAGGIWSVTLPAEDLADLNSGRVTLLGRVTDAAGNTATATRFVNVNTDRAGLSIDPVTGDNLINAAEAGAAITLSGHALGVATGTVVNLTLNGHRYTARVDAEGHWATEIPAADAAQFPDGILSLVARSSSLSSGQLYASAALGVAVNTLPAPTVNTLFADGLLGQADAAQPLGQSIAGNTGITGNGQTVVVSLNGQQIAAVVEATGAWSATLPAAWLTALPDGQHSVTVTATDAAGNQAQAEGSFQVDFTPPALTLDPLSGDNVLLNSDTNTTISGTADLDAVGQKAVVTLFGVPYQAEVLWDGSWALYLSGLNQMPNGIYPITVSVADAAGNVSTLEQEIEVARNLDIAITRNALTGDNVLDAAEVQVDQVITGSTVGVEAGQTLTLRFNGVNYTTTVASGGEWRVAIPQSALAGLENGERIVIEARVTDIHGNPAVQSQAATVNLEQGGLAFNPVAGDNTLNAEEAAGAVVLSGVTARVAEGETLSLALDGHAYSTTVAADGSWRFTVPAADVARLPDGQVPLTASVTDVDGTPITQTIDLGVHITTLPAPTLNTPFADGALGAAEAAVGQALSGTTGISGDGQQVSVAVGENRYNAIVNSSGNWTVTIPAADLQALPEGRATVTVTAQDAAGNSRAVSGTFTVDFTAPELQLNPVTGDNLITARDVQNGFAVTGSTTAAAAGLLVAVVLNSVSYHATVQENGNWSAAIPARALAGQPNGEYPLTASLTDAAGNVTTLTSHITLGTAPAPAATESTAAPEAATVAAAGHEAAVADHAGSTLSAAPAAAEASPAETAYSIGGQVIDVTTPGSDVQGGSGNDLFALHTTEIQHLDGGSGLDTLLLAGTDQHLDLSALGLDVAHIEIIDLGESGTNSLRLDERSAQTLTDQPDDNLLVRGAAGSQLTLAGGGDAWAADGQRVVDGLTFDVYHNGALESGHTLGDVLVQHGIQVQQA